MRWAPWSSRKSGAPQGIKEASYDLPGKTVRVCVASGLANAKIVLDGVQLWPDAV